MSGFVFALAAAFGLVACASPDGPAPPPPEAVADSLAQIAADPPFVGSWWRLASLGGDAPTEGVRPVLIFTETPAERDTYDRAYPDSLADWRIVTGDLGVGHLHAPYQRTGDTLRFAPTYDYTRLSDDAEIAQAQRLADALSATRTMAQDGPRLALLAASGDTLATFTADPPRPPGPLDGIEWVLTDIGAIPGGAPSVSDIASRPAPEGTRATLTFTAQRLGPGEDDGFDRFHGYSGCNWYGGGYRLAPEAAGRFRLTTSGPPMATQRGCAQPASGVEDAVLGALYQAAAVEVSRDGEPTLDRPTSLALFDSSGTLMLAFRRHEPYAVDLGALKRGRWRFASTDSPYTTNARGAEVAFADSTFEGANGCLRVSGTYRVEGDDMWVQTQASDDSACPQGGPHRAVPVSSGKLAVSADRLVLYDENGSAITFQRTP